MHVCSISNLSLNGTLYWLGRQNMLTAPLQKGKIASESTCWLLPQHTLLKDRNMVTEQSSTRQSNWSSDLQHSTLGWMGVWGSLTQSVGCTCQALASIRLFQLYPSNWSRQTNTQPYSMLKVIESSGWGLIVQRVIHETI